MPEPSTATASVGLTETHIIDIALPAAGLPLACGRALKALQVAYETYGERNAAGDNVVLVCHALTGDAHAAGYHHAGDKKPGWWESMIGPGKGIDTREHFVVCSNILGGCSGTTGPSSTDPDTGKPYGSSFPPVTVSDMVDVQRLLLEQLGIHRLKAVVGGSFGGMQVLQWAVRYPEMVDGCICIASSVSLSAQALAFDVLGRNSIVTDPAWTGGDYYDTGDTPQNGLAQARMLAHITYLSPEIMKEKFGREREADDESPTGFGARFQVERYLTYQGGQFINRFDANSYLHITHAMDTFDLAEGPGGVAAAFAEVRAKFLVVAVSSDWLFPSEQSIELARALMVAGKHVSYCQLTVPYGHDAFLVDVDHLSRVVRTFLGGGAAVSAVPPEERGADDAMIESVVTPGSRVLDLGCGDGDLLARLTRTKGIKGLGMDIDFDQLVRTMAKGQAVFQADIDEGFAHVSDGAYDYAILSQTLHVVRKPRFVLREMLRVAKEGVVSFPNFGKWSNRLRLLLLGQVPAADASVYAWYDAPNLHLPTLRDFVELCRQEGIKIVDMECIPDGFVGRLLLRLGLRSPGTGRVFVRITRDGE